MERELKENESMVPEVITAEQAMKVEDNPSDLNDDLAKDLSEEMLKKYQSEIKVMNSNIEAATELKKDTEDRLEIEKQVWALHLEGDNVKPTNPKNHLEECDKFWELQKLLLKMDYDLQLRDREETIKSHEKGIENMQNNIKSIEEKIKDLEVKNE